MLKRFKFMSITYFLALIFWLIFFFNVLVTNAVLGVIYDSSSQFVKWNIDGAILEYVKVFVAILISATILIELRESKQ